MLKNIEGAITNGKSRETDNIAVCPFVIFLLSIVLSVRLRFTDSDYLPLVSSNSSYTRRTKT